MKILNIKKNIDTCKKVYIIIIEQNARKINFYMFLATIKLN